MAEATAPNVTFLQKILLFCLLAGVAAGGLFPPVAGFFVGPEAGNPLFILTCLFFGVALGGATFLFVRSMLNRQLRRQLALLEPLCGSTVETAATVEELEEVVKGAVEQVEDILGDVLDTTDKLMPHFASLADSGRTLYKRAHDGLSAARHNRNEINAVNEKQEGVTVQIQTLSERSQNEAALSRELSASLEETAEAMDHSTEKFLETTSSVDEMASSLREVSERSDEISSSVEGTAKDLDAFGEALNTIREGVSASAATADEVRKDAENGLSVVQSSMEEMERIEQDSKEAMAAMKRLSQQTGEVVKIIEVIKELVSDTELLAFNAAIIAAQAGEEGKGFAVVAEEIRDLADRTTTSAQEIHRIVEAIGEDTGAVTTAVERTGSRIGRGRELSRSTGEALTKILESAREAATVSGELSVLTGQEGERARSLIEDAGRSLRSIKAIARAIQEQQDAIGRIQEGVTQMKAAADQIARGMEEQVRANKEFDRGLIEREEQIEAIRDANQFQLETFQRIKVHFSTSEERLQKNADRTARVTAEIEELRSLTEHLRDIAARTGKGESRIVGGVFKGEGEDWVLEEEMEQEQPSA